MVLAIEDMAAVAHELIDDLRYLRNGADTPDPAKYVLIDAVRDLLSSRHADHTERDQKRALAKVKDALDRGFVTPGMKDWATAICARDEASFDTFLSKSVPAFAQLMTPLVPPYPPAGGEQQHAQSETAAAICAQLGLKPEALGE